MRLAFVSPRYGAGIVGGAEAHLRELAEGLAARGHQVRVLTTGALDPDSWENEAAPGVTVEDGVEVHRFESVPNPDRPGRDALDHRVLGGAPLGAADELAWVSSRYEAPGLVRHVAEEGARYEAIVYAPYLAWTTLRCLPVAPERSVLVPCLHDEPAARLRVVRAALAGAADVWFLSEPEHALAHRLVTLGEHCTVGGGVNVPERYDAEGFRHRHGLDRPFVLYAGRREDGKGWPGALGGITVATGRLGLDLDLVTIGSGAVSVPAHLIGRVVDLGRLDPSEVPDAFAAAAAHVQPSTLESFSRSVMESWLAGTVVVGNAAGAVVSWHCERSGGGLLYGDELEMAECFALVLGQPSLVAEMAARGRRYVLAEHLWPGVLDRAEEALDALVARREGAGSGAPESAAGEVRGRAARTRACAAAGRDSSAVAEDVPLAEWLPAPGLGVSPALVASPAGERPGSQVTGSPRPPRASRSWRLAGALARRAERHPRVRPLVRAVRALRAGRRAWLEVADAVAPPQDVR